ncbi:MAG: LuxR C-terminal-related transcriptional regulator [Chloroflexales bacterium]|nr:LuxR C-terminal-related transcriptional regulator [Chloroflexales bacterium]
MSRALPTIRAGMLYHAQSLDQPIAVGSAAWRQWLAAAESRSFRFEHPRGSFTARREQINDGVYWYAYRKIAGKLRKTYLGKAENLTLDRLEVAATTLDPSSLRSNPRDLSSKQAPANFDRSALMATKLIPPPVRAHRVTRARLLNQLDTALQRPLTLVLALAGAGKTTLVSEWVQSLAQPVAWVSLDAHDNDPPRFWSYVATALGAVAPEIEPTALRPLHTAPDTIVAALAQALAATKANIVLILDDYHTIAEPSIHTTIALLLTHMIPRLHIVLASRTDPPLPLPRLRARGQLLEIGAAALRFTPDEAATFLDEMMAAPLSEDDVQFLTERTEGWITGLHLAALALGPQGDHVAVPTFSGNHRYVLDYLADEVLLQQPAWVQTFLLRTAIVDRLSAPLCAALLHDEAQQSFAQPEVRPKTAAAMLDWIERANLFLAPIDTERRWYRYHALFTDFLRARLHAIAPETVPELHRRASMWYEQHGFTAQAIDHAIAAAAWERAVALIVDVAQPLIIRGEVAMLLGWLDMLPAVALQGNVRLNLLYAWALVVVNQVNDLDARLYALETMIGPDAEAALFGEVAAIRSVQAAIRGDFGQAIAWAQPALEQLPPTNIYRSTLGLIVGATHEWQGDIAAAARCYIDAGRDSRRVGNTIVDVGASCSLATLYIIQGEFRAAAAEYHAAIRRATDAAGQPLPAAGIAFIELGELHYLWNDLPAAQAAVEQGLALIEAWADPDLLALGYTMLARIRLAQGGVAEANGLLDTAAQLRAKVQASLNGTSLQAEQVRWWLHTGESVAAGQWAQQFEREVDHAIQPLRAPEYLALVRVYLAQAKLRAAQQWLDRLLPWAETGGRRYLVVDLLVLQALVAAAGGNTRRALAALQRALALAGAERPIRIFVDAGPPIVPLLHKLRALQRRRQESGTIPLDYLNALLAVFPPAMVEVEAVQSPVAVGMIEPLSVREQEVLHLMAAGLGNRAIADKLVIAPSTVKRHLLNIYRKLDAHSRVEALHRARALQLVI